MSDLFSLSVHEITKKIKDGKLTSVEICKSYIDRINKFEKDTSSITIDKPLAPPAGSPIGTDLNSWCNWD